MMSEGEEIGRHLYPDSGDTFKWVAVLRAGDRFWSTTGEFGFVRLAEEGTRGNGPQILAIGGNRLVFASYSWL
jgi:hypothetical protein